MAENNDNMLITITGADGKVHTFNNFESALESFRYKDSADIAYFEYASPEEAKALAEVMPPAVTDEAWKIMRPICERRIRAAIQAQHPDMSVAENTETVTSNVENNTVSPAPSDNARQSEDNTDEVKPAETSPDKADPETEVVTDETEPAPEPTSDQITHDINSEPFRFLGNWTNRNFKSVAGDGKEYTFATMEAAYQACKTSDADIIAKLARPDLKGGEAAKIGNAIETGADFEAHKQDFTNAVVHAKASTYPWFADQLRQTSGTFVNSNRLVDPIWTAAINHEHNALRATVANTVEPTISVNNFDTKIGQRPLYQWAAEYVFAKAMADISRANAANDAPIVTSRLAHQIRKDASGEISTIASALHSGNTKELTDAVNRIASMVGAAQNQTPVTISEQSIVNRIDEFKSHLTGDDPWVPVTPYDPTIADFETSLTDGTRMMFAKASALSAPDLEWSKDGLLNGDTSKVKLYNLQSIKLKNDAGEYEPHQEYIPVKTQLVTTMDRLGLTGLAKSLTQAEYRAVSDAVNNIKTDEYAPAEPKDIQKATHILDWLRTNGMSYTITTNKGNYGAQVVAEIEGTHYAVTLTNPGAKDKAQYQSYIGRVYDTVTAKSFYVTSGSNRVEVPDFEGQELLPLAYVFGKEVKTDLTPIEQAGVNQSVQTTNRNGASGTVMVGRINGTTVGIHSEVQNGVATERTLAPVDLEKALESAKSNFATQVNIDGLVAEYERQKAAGADFTRPQYSDDERVASMQDLYWRYLTTDGLALKKPDHYVTTDLMEALNFSDDFDDSGMSKADAVKAHLRMTLDSEFGSWTDDNVRLSPKYMMLYMDNNGGTEHDREKALFKAIHDQGLTMQNLIGGVDEFENIKAINNSLEFNPSHAHQMKDEQSPLMQAAYHKIADTLKTSAGIVSAPDERLEDNIMIDDRGVVQYKAYMVVKQKVTSSYHKDGQTVQTGFNTIGDVWAALKSGDPVQVEHAQQYIKPVTGYIGQIFDYDQKLSADGINAIRTKYPAGNNALLVPGYTAQIMPDKPGYETSPASRTMCYGYEDHLMTAIGRTIRRDIESYTSGAPEIGTAYSIDEVYRRLYDEKFPLDYMKENAYGRTQEDKRTILATLAKKLKFDQRYQEGADVINANLAMQAHLADPGNDSFSSAARELNYSCVNRITQDFAGYTSLNATSTAQNIGLVRFLTEGASVDPKTHLIHPSMKDGKIDVNDETPAMKNERFRNSQYDAADRIQKAFNDYMTALSIAKDAGFAMADVGGWTMDDGYVISKSFADKYKVPDEEWNKKHPDEAPRYRSLEVGDKISDCHGNKGTIALVVDPSTDDRIAESRGMLDAVKLFRANPSLDVVGAAYPGISRQNGGTYLDGHEQPMDLIDPRDRSVKHSFACRTEFGILSQTADKKSRIYGVGEGRTASAQLSWILSAEKLPHTMQEIYGNNLSASVGLREYLNVLGGDVDEIGRIGYGIRTQAHESRYIFEVPSITDKESALKFLGVTKEGKICTTSDAIDRACDEFLKEISKRGGYLVVPKGLQVSAYLDACRPNDNSKPCFLTDDKGRTLLPVMGPAQRAGTELYDGTVQEHDYTKFYRQIYRAMVQYEVDRYQLDTSLKLTGEQIKNTDPIRKRFDEASKKLQGAYNSLASRVYDDQLKPGAKHSWWKDKMMSRKMPQSATMVMTANPALDIGELGMSFESAKKLGYISKDAHTPHDAISKGEMDANGRIIGDGAMVWRDPTLRSGAVRYMTVKVLPGDMKGVSINPFADKSFDGDFDGDQLGVTHLRSKEANDELRKKISYANTMLDESSPYQMDANGSPATTLKAPVKDEDGHVVWHDVMNPDGKPATYEHHELFFNHGLDVVSGEAVKPELKAVYKDIETRAGYWRELEQRDSYMACAAMLINATKATAQKIGISTDGWGDDLSGMTPARFAANYKKTLSPANPAGYRTMVTLLTRLDANRSALAVKGLAADPNYKRMFGDDTYQQAKQGLVKELSAYTHECYKASAMNNNISFGDMPEHLQTVAKYVNEGCKGKPAKLIGYMKALGVTVNTVDDTGKPCIVTDADKHINISSVTFAGGGDGILKWIDEHHYTGFTAQDKQEQQQANATKTCLTGQAGAQSQHGMSALCNTSAKEVLALTYYVTQSVLQVKHSAEEAELKTKLLSDVVTALWQGRKIEKVDGSWRVALREAKQYEYTDNLGRKHVSEVVPKNASGVKELTPVIRQGEKATLDEWTKTFKAFYEDSDGMNVGKLSDRFVNTVAKGLADLNKNTMLGVSSDGLEKKAPLLYQLAYEKRFGRASDGSALQNILRGHNITEHPVSLFANKVGSDPHAYMPQQIRDNLTAVMKGEPQNVVPIIAKECQVGYEPKFHRALAGVHKKKEVEAPKEKEVCAEQHKSHISY